MEFKTHLALAFLIAILYLSFSKNINQYIFFPIVLFFSLLPDMDHSKSYISRKFPIISAPIHFFFKHRGFFHSIFPALVLFIIFYYFIYTSLAFGILIGYLAHLIGDSMTKQGVNFLNPFSTLVLRGPIETGSFTEFIVFIALVAIDGFLVINWI
jgi:inner membrane protein